MLQRSDGMWWGSAVESPDPAGTARFYASLVGWAIVHEEPGTTVLAPPPGGVFVVFQQADGYRRPTWPPVDGAQRPMTHFDFQVGDLDASVAEAIRLGAALADHQPQPNVRVMLDPDGRPFCLCLDDG